MKHKLGSLMLLVTLLLSVIPFSSIARAAPSKESIFKESPEGWILTTTNPNANYAPTFLGNGYMAERIPAQGMGYTPSIVPIQTQIAGFYAQPEVRASLPTWSTLTFSDGSSTYSLTTQTHASGSSSHYQQVLDLHNGLLTTSITWTSSAGNTADLQYQVLVDQAHPHVAAVQLIFTPHWSGQASVTDLLDGSSAKLTTGSGKGFDPLHKQVYETVTARGSGIVAALASQLDLAGVSQAISSEQDTGVDQSVEQRATFPVMTGHTYSITKYIGITTSQDDSKPQSTARLYAMQAATLGYQRLRNEHEAAWHSLWQSDIQIADNAQLQLEARASMFYLLESTRAGVNWSLSPGGLSSDAYSGHIFWDAETWMYPPLLLTHPDIALGVNTYREQRLLAYENHALDSGWQGARVAWESALSGNEQELGPTGIYEQHITADVALAQWQYYLATGDSTWLATKGWPVISQAARFWASRVVADPSGGYDVQNVMGPDEYHYPVNTSAYTNAAAATTLRLATQAAQIIGQTPDPSWLLIAHGLQVPIDRTLNIHPEFAGYAGDTIKQADVTLLQYPWEYPMPTQVARADLTYYASRVDPNGPSMSDAINVINACALNDPHTAYSNLQRSIQPFLQAPFDQFSETHNGGAFTFITGAGGFLQEFYYGFTGLRWRADRLHIDPCLPPQIHRVTLTHLSWQGRTFDLALTPSTTTLTLISGPALPVEVGTQALQTLPSPGRLVIR